MSKNKLSILIAIQSDKIRNQNVQFLQTEGYHVVEATDGMGALTALSDNEIDLILVDHNLTCTNDYDVIEQMKGDDKYETIPIIVLNDNLSTSSLVRIVEAGADDQLPYAFEPVLLNAKVNHYLERKRRCEELNRERRLANGILDIVIPVGIALSSETDLDHLLEEFLTKAKKLANADAASLYLRTEDDRLKFVIARTKSLGVTMGGSSGNPVSFSTIQLFVDGRPNNCSVAAYVAATGKTLNIPDVYGDLSVGLETTREYDRSHGYQSISMLVIPLINNDSYVVGVLQLINAIDPKSATIIPFERNTQRALEAMSSLATAILEAYKRERTLHQEIRELKIEIDLMKRDREVENITQSDYFADILSQADKFRNS